MNREYAQHIIQTLLQCGIAEFYVCAGARNIPLVEAVLSIQSEKKIVFNHFEERSAAFYALGRIKSLNKPVVIITTSGTAVAELLPATIEAYYAGLPLILLTADRPRTFRGTGAPQTIEQKDIFKNYVSKCYDLESLDDLHYFSSELLKDLDDEHLYPHFDTCSKIKQNKPLHINVCFDQPLQSGNINPICLEQTDKEKQGSTLDIELEFKEKSQSHVCVNSNLIRDVNKLKLFIRNSKNLLVIVSKIHWENRTFVLEFIKTLNCPVYVESISNLRGCLELSHLMIYCADDIWNNEKKSGYCIDSIIKIGGTPTHRIWRDLSESRKDIKVFSVHDLPFFGMCNAEHVTTCLKCFFTLVSDKIEINTKRQNNPIQSFLTYDKQSFEKSVLSLSEHSFSEKNFVYELSKKITSNPYTPTRIYLGNSLPIRHWDAFAFDPDDNKNITIEASRGANGIDGQISTFLGFADESCENWGIFGDLTALYDMAGLWILNQRSNLNVNIVIINNRGGKIFNKVLEGSHTSFMQNEHTIEFKQLANMWSLSYTALFDSAELDPNQISKGKNLFEFKVV